MSQPEARPRRTGIAIAMIVIGLVILIPSGLCTSVFAGGAFVSLFTESGNTQDFFMVLTEALVFGGPFIAIGLVLLILGLRRPRVR